MSAVQEHETLTSKEREELEQLRRINALLQNKVMLLENRLHGPPPDFVLSHKRNRVEPSSSMELVQSDAAAPNKPQDGSLDTENVGKQDKPDYSKVLGAGVDVGKEKRKRGAGKICEHGKNKTWCKECGSLYCKHAHRKAYCAECGGSQICEHGKRRYICRECGGNSICEHGNRKERCKKCGGSQICGHGRRKDLCKDCRAMGGEVRGISVGL